MEAEVDGIKYIINLSEKTAIAGRYRFIHQDVLIPKSINYQNEEYTVTAMLAGDFQDSNVKTVIFDHDSQIQAIPMFSFQSSNLEKVTLSPGITKIERSAFDQCSNLIELTIPPDSQLKQIETDSFQYTKIESLSIPSKLTKLDEGWNKYIDKLVNITVMPNNSSYIDINHEYLLGKSKPEKQNFDLLVFASRQIIDAKIPDTIEIIGSYSFQNNKRIESFTLPANVKRINRYAFDSCTSLKKFIIPSNLKLQYLGEYSLHDISITSLVIPNCIRFLHSSFTSLRKLKIVQIEEESQLNAIYSWVFNSYSDIILMVPANLNNKLVNGNELKTRPEYILINIKDNSGNLNTYRIKNEESVWSLKKKIESRMKVSFDQIDLRYINHRFKNNEIVSNHIVIGFKWPIELFIEDDKSKTININFITDEEKEFSLNLNPEYTILQVIEKVAKYLQVEITQIQLFYKNELLNNSFNSITLNHYWIHDGSTINVTIKKISRNQPGSYKIFVKLLTGKHLTFDVLPTDKVRYLVMKLEIETGIPHRRMLLTFEGRNINNIDPLGYSDPTLEEKGVVDDSTLHLSYLYL